MNRLFISLGGFLFLFVARRLLFWIVRESSGDDAVDGGGRVSFFATLVLRLAGALGVEQLDGTGFLMLIVAAMFSATILGWMYHLAFAERAFGPWLNGLVAFAAGSFSVIYWAQFAPADAGTGAIIVGLLGSSVALLALVLVKKMIFEGVGDFARGEWSTKSSRGPVADRIDAATRRRK